MVATGEDGVTAAAARSRSPDWKTMVRSDNCLARIGAGVAIGGAVGGAVGACYGTFEAFRYRIPGLLKIRYIGQTTVGSAAIFGLFLGAGSLIHCGKSY
ncbi:hypothetical protein U9M48_034092 [Paspalum notatum var. saurae]|uniref:Reactive oxygen species modulator 1 n=1 Tax=Paspalum notatum var. saurae TaxID=547442 RepID=A0AAQ3UBX6_PASNO